MSEMKWSLSSDESEEDLPLVGRRNPANKTGGKAQEWRKKGKRGKKSTSPGADLDFPRFQCTSTPSKEQFSISQGWLSKSPSAILDKTPSEDEFDLTDSAYRSPVPQSSRKRNVKRNNVNRKSDKGHSSVIELSDSSEEFCDTMNHSQTVLSRKDAISAISDKTTSVGTAKSQAHFKLRGIFQKKTPPGARTSSLQSAPVCSDDELPDLQETKSGFLSSLTKIKKTSKDSSHGSDSARLKSFPEDVIPESEASSTENEWETRDTNASPSSRNDFEKLNVKSGCNKSNEQYKTYGENCSAQSGSQNRQSEPQWLSSQKEHTKSRLEGQRNTGQDPLYSHPASKTERGFVSSDEAGSDDSEKLFQTQASTSKTNKRHRQFLQVHADSKQSGNPIAAKISCREKLSSSSVHRRKGKSRICMSSDSEDESHGISNRFVRRSSLKKVSTKQINNVSTIEPTKSSGAIQISETDTSDEEPLDLLEMRSSVYSGLSKGKTSRVTRDGGASGGPGPSSIDVIPESEASSTENEWETGGINTNPSRKDNEKETIKLGHSISNDNEKPSISSGSQNRQSEPQWLSSQKEQTKSSLEGQRIEQSKIKRAIFSSDDTDSDDFKNHKSQTPKAHAESRRQNLHTQHIDSVPCGSQLKDSALPPASVCVQQFNSISSVGSFGSMPSLQKMCSYSNTNTRQPSTQKDLSPKDPDSQAEESQSLPMPELTQYPMSVDLTQDSDSEDTVIVEDAFPMPELSLHGPEKDSSIFGSKLGKKMENKNLNSTQTSTLSSLGLLSEGPPVQTSNVQVAREIYAPSGKTSFQARSLSEEPTFSQKPEYVDMDHVSNENALNLHDCSKLQADFQETSKRSLQHSVSHKKSGTLEVSSKENKEYSNFSVNQALGISQDTTPILIVCKEKDGGTVQIDPLCEANASITEHCTENSVKETHIQTTMTKTEDLPQPVIHEDLTSPDDDPGLYAVVKQEIDEEEKEGEDEEVKYSVVEDVIHIFDSDDEELFLSQSMDQDDAEEDSRTKEMAVKEGSQWWDDGDNEMMVEACAETSSSSNQINNQEGEKPVPQNNETEKIERGIGFSDEDLFEDDGFSDTDDGDFSLISWSFSQGILEDDFLSDTEVKDVYDAATQSAEKDIDGADGDLCSGVDVFETSTQLDASQDSELTITSIRQDPDSASYYCDPTQIDDCREERDDMYMAHTQVDYIISDEDDLMEKLYDADTQLDIEEVKEETTLSEYDVMTQLYDDEYTDTAKTMESMVPVLENKAGVTENPYEIATLEDNSPTPCGDIDESIIYEMDTQIDSFEMESSEQIQKDNLEDTSSEKLMDENQIQDLNENIHQMRPQVESSTSNSERERLPEVLPAQTSDLFSKLFSHRSEIRERAKGEQHGVELWENKGGNLQTNVSGGTERKSDLERLTSSRDSNASARNVTHKKQQADVACMGDSRIGDSHIVEYMASTQLDPGMSRTRPPAAQIFKTSCNSGASFSTSSNIFEKMSHVLEVSTDQEMLAKGQNSAKSCTQQSTDSVTGKLVPPENREENVSIISVNSSSSGEHHSSSSSLSPLLPGRGADKMKIDAGNMADSKKSPTRDELNVEEDVMPEDFFSMPTLADDQAFYEDDFEEEEEKVEERDEEFDKPGKVNMDTTLKLQIGEKFILEKRKSITVPALLDNVEKATKCGRSRSNSNLDEKPEKLTSERTKSFDEEIAREDDSEPTLEYGYDELFEKEQKAISEASAEHQLQSPYLQASCFKTPVDDKGTCSTKISLPESVGSHPIPWKRDQKHSQSKEKKEKEKNKNESRTGKRGACAFPESSVKRVHLDRASTSSNIFHKNSEPHKRSIHEVQSPEDGLKGSPEASSTPKKAKHHFSVAKDHSSDSSHSWLQSEKNKNKLCSKEKKKTAKMTCSKKVKQSKKKSPNSSCSEVQDANIAKLKKLVESRKAAGSAEIVVKDWGKSKADELLKAGEDNDVEMPCTQDVREHGLPIALPPKSSKKQNCSKPDPGISEVDSESIARVEKRDRLHKEKQRKDVSSSEGDKPKTNKDVDRKSAGPVTHPESSKKQHFSKGDPDISEVDSKSIAHAKERNHLHKEKQRKDVSSSEGDKPKTNKDVDRKSTGPVTHPESSKKQHFSKGDPDISEVDSKSIAHAKERNHLHKEKQRKDVSEGGKSKTNNDVERKSAGTVTHPESSKKQHFSKGGPDISQLDSKSIAHAKERNHLHKEKQRKDVSSSEGDKPKTNKDVDRKSAGPVTHPESSNSKGTMKQIVNEKVVEDKLNREKNSELSESKLRPQNEYNLASAAESTKDGSNAAAIIPPVAIEKGSNSDIDRAEQGRHGQEPSFHPGSSQFQRSKNAALPKPYQEKLVNKLQFAVVDKENKSSFLKENKERQQGIQLPSVPLQSAGVVTTHRHRRPSDAQTPGKGILKRLEVDVQPKAKISKTNRVLFDTSRNQVVEIENIRRQPAPAAPDPCFHQAGKGDMRPFRKEMDLISKILTWNADWLPKQDLMKEPPPVCGNNSCPTKLLMFYEDVSSYQEATFNLLLLEIWASIHRDWKQLNHDQHIKVYMFKEPEHASEEQKLHGLVDISLKGVVKQSEKHHIPYQGSLLLLHMSGVSKTKPKGSPPEQCQQLAHVKSVTMRNLADADKMGLLRISHGIMKNIPAMQASGKMLEFTLVVTVRYRYQIFNRKLLSFQKISHLTTWMRQFQAMVMLPQNPLCYHLLNPRHSSESSVFVHPVVNPEENLLRKFNQEQATAIATIRDSVLEPLRKPKIFMLQGPPGTGKTDTIVALIHQILLKSGFKVRICLTAQSNAAVDEVAKRIIDFSKKLCRPQNLQEISVVRIGGNPKMVHQNVQPYHLEALVQDRCEQEKQALLPNNVRQEMESINSRISSLEAKLQDRSTPEAQKALARADLVKFNREKRTLQQDISNRQITPRENYNAQCYVLDHAHVVCGTLSSFGQIKISQILRRENSRFRQEPFKCLIIDEATQAIELDSLVPLQYLMTKLVMVGDREQLPATVISQFATEKRLNRSLFERLQDRFEAQYGSSHNPVMMLKTQYRMQPEILSLPNQFFYHDQLVTARGVKDRHSVLSPYLVFDLQCGQEMISEGSSNRSVSNDEEASCIAQLCELILNTWARKEGISGLLHRIGVICPYDKQTVKIKELLKQRKLDGIEVNTVDGFQGREKDVIILSCVRAQADPKSIGFVADKKRMNVALTRARLALYIMGNFRTLRTNDLWDYLYKDAMRREKIVRISHASCFQKEAFHFIEKT